MTMPNNSIELQQFLRWLGATYGYGSDIFNSFRLKVAKEGTKIGWPPTRDRWAWKDYDWNKFYQSWKSPQSPIPDTTVKKTTPTTSPPEPDQPDTLPDGTERINIVTDDTGKSWSVLQKWDAIAKVWTESNVLGEAYPTTEDTKGMTDYQKAQLIQQDRNNQLQLDLANKQLNLDTESAQWLKDYQSQQIQLQENAQLAEYQANPKDWITAWSYERGMNKPAPAVPQKPLPSQEELLSTLRSYKADVTQRLDTLQSQLKDEYSPTYRSSQYDQWESVLKHELSQANAQEQFIQQGQFQGAFDWVNKIADKYIGGNAGYAPALATVQRYAQDPNSAEFTRLSPDEQNQLRLATQEMQIGAFNPALQPAKPLPYEAPPAPVGMDWVSQLVPGWTTGQPIPTGTARLASAQLWNQVPWSQREMFGGYLQSGYQSGIPTLRDYQEMIANRLPTQNKTAQWRTANQI